jgi:hypothetical protein
VFRPLAMPSLRSVNLLCLGHNCFVYFSMKFRSLVRVDFYTYIGRNSPVSGSFDYSRTEINSFLYGAFHSPNFELCVQ